MVAVEALPQPSNQPRSGELSFVTASSAPRRRR